jgi:hypothetical protein
MTVNEIQDFIYKGVGGKFGSLNTLSKFTTIDEVEGVVTVHLYTNDHVYAIAGTTSDYLGCIASTRKPRAGENHTRGNDLADGKLNDKTMLAILQDIISYELVDE